MSAQHLWGLCGCGGGVAVGVVWLWGWCGYGRIHSRYVSLCVIPEREFSLYDFCKTVAVVLPTEQAGRWGLF